MGDLGHAGKTSVRLSTYARHHQHLLVFAIAALDYEAVKNRESCK
jgi:hypothetical protein